VDAFALRPSRQIQAVGKDVTWTWPVAVSGLGADPAAAAGIGAFKAVVTRIEMTRHVHGSMT
jgi:hypothetical protein